MLKLLQSDQILIKNDLDALPQVLLWFDQFNQEPVPYTVWLQSQLVLAEAFTNAVRHAHRGYSEEPRSEGPMIEMEVRVLQHQIELRIWDCGPESNLGDQIANLSQEMDRNAESGRGLKLMKKMADSLSYNRTSDQRNCLLFIKTF